MRPETPAGDAPAPAATRRFLFLQGPTNFVFAKVAARLRASGHEVRRIDFCVGDRLFWRGGGAVAYRGTPAGWPAFIAAFLDDHAITDILLLGEKRAYHRVAIAAARERSIAVSVTDFGYLRPDWIAIERDGLNGESRFPRDPAAILALAEGLPGPDRVVRFPHRALNQALWDMAFHLSSAFFPWPYPHFRRHTLNHPVATYLGTGWRLARQGIESRRAARVLEAVRSRGPYFVFAMQMEDDFSLRAYSRFPDLDAALGETIASFARHAPIAASLVCKLHPLDPGLKDWRARIAGIAAAAGAAGRVSFVDGGDLDELLRGSAGAVTVNSTAGLRAIELRRPVIALGEAIYSIPGLAFGGPLDAFWTQAPPPDERLADAAIRAMGAMLHVRGSMYDRAGIEAAAAGIAHRLHRGLVNVPLAAVLRGEPFGG